MKNKVGQNVLLSTKIFIMLKLVLYMYQAEKNGNRMESSEIDPHIGDNLLYDKGDFRAMEKGFFKST